MRFVSTYRLAKLWGSFITRCLQKAIHSFPPHSNTHTHTNMNEANLFFLFFLFFFLYLKKKQERGGGGLRNIPTSLWRGQMEGSISMLLWVISDRLFRVSWAVQKSLNRSSSRINQRPLHYRNLIKRGRARQVGHRSVDQSGLRTVRSLSPLELVV